MPTLRNLGDRNIVVWKVENIHLSKPKTAKRQKCSNLQSFKRKPQKVASPLTSSSPPKTTRPVWEPSRTLVSMFGIPRPLERLPVLVSASLKPRASSTELEIFNQLSAQHDRPQISRAHISHRVEGSGTTTITDHPVCFITLTGKSEEDTPPSSSPPSPQRTGRGSQRPEK